MLTDRQRNSYEARLRAAFADASSTRAAELLRLLGDPPDVRRVPAVFWAELSAELVASLGPVIEEMAKLSAAGLGASVGASVNINWTLVNGRAVAWAERYSFELVKGITANTQAKLQELVAGFFSKPDQELRALGTDIGKMFGPVRGEMIAVTETTRAASQGEQALVAEIRNLNPRIKVVELWRTSNDELTCPICRPLNGKERGDGWTTPPPAHVRCRCGLYEQFSVPQGANA